MSDMNIALEVVKGIDLTAAYQKDLTTSSELLKRIITLEP